MSIQDYFATGGFIVAIVGLITTYLLQRDAKKLRELEKENKKYKGRLLKALNAIKGYQMIEAEHAEKEGIEVASYRSKIRKDKQELFNSSFLTPKNVDEMMSDIEN
jgi:hypothetical protein